MRVNISDSQGDFRLRGRATIKVTLVRVNINYSQGDFRLRGRATIKVTLVRVNPCLRDVMRDVRVNMNHRDDQLSF